MDWRISKNAKISKKLKKYILKMPLNFLIDKNYKKIIKKLYYRLFFFVFLRYAKCLYPLRLHILLIDLMSLVLLLEYWTKLLNWNTGTK